MTRTFQRTYRRWLFSTGMQFIVPCYVSVKVGLERLPNYNDMAIGFTIILFGFWCGVYVRIN